MMNGRWREVLGRVGAGWDVPKYLSSTEGELGVLLTPGCYTLCRWSSAQEPTADPTGGLPEPGADSAEKARGDSCSSPWESEVGAVWLAGFRACVHFSLSALLFLETRLYTCVNECMEISRAGPRSLRDQRTAFSSAFSTRDSPLPAPVGWNYSAVSFSMATMGLWGQPIVLVITYPSDQSSGSSGKCLFALELRRLTKSTQ